MPLRELAITLHAIEYQKQLLQRTFGFEKSMNKRHLTHAKSVGQQSSQRLLERYNQHLHFAELKLSAGDRVGAEKELQHAEHFFRTAAEAKNP